MLEDPKYNKTPLIATLTYRGYGFCWFADSNLAVQCANELKAVGLIAECKLYASDDFGGIDLTSLPSQWQEVLVGDQLFYLCRHNSIKVNEWRQIGSVISQTINKFKGYEKSYY